MMQPRKHPKARRQRPWAYTKPEGAGYTWRIVKTNAYVIAPPGDRVYATRQAALAAMVRHAKALGLAGDLANEFNAIRRQILDERKNA